MPKFQKKPVQVRAITFEALVAHGLRSGAPCPGTPGMPWSFQYEGQPITHENDDCYLIPTLEGTMKFQRGDMLITGVKGEIYPCKKEIFDATYSRVPCNSEGFVCESSTRKPEEYCEACR